MQRIKIITPDPILEKLLILLAERLLEQKDTIVLLDAVWMDHLQEFPGDRIILFTASADPGYLTEAQKSGATGFWYLSPSEESLSQVLAGQPAFPEKAPEVQFGNVKRSALTLREMDVLRQLVGGKSDAEIAQRLNCSVPTVKHHIQQLRIKSGFSNRTEIAVAAVSVGLIDCRCENYTFV